MQRARRIAGRIVLVLVGGLMHMAGAGKVFGFAPEEIVTKLRESGLGEETRLIGLGELATGLLLILPWTAALGALLASSFWGGAIAWQGDRGQVAGCMKPRSLPSAFASIWRMRSADTPYLSASSCSVAFSSVIQRFTRMSRLRSSSRPIAV